MTSDCYCLRLIRKVLRVVVLGGATVLWPLGGAAQTLPFDHVHISVPDVSRAVAWYQEFLGGRAVPNEPANRLFIGETRVNFLENDNPLPTDDRAIDHVGFVVVDPVVTAGEMLASGGTQDGAPSHLPNGVALLDPWGTRIELSAGAPARVDHLQLRSAEPESDLEWLHRMFGGEQTVWNGRGALRFREVVVAVTSGSAKGSEGAAIDHIGWRPSDIDQTVAKLRENGVRLLSDIEPRGPRVRIVFVEGPSGLKIELVQR